MLRVNAEYKGLDADHLVIEHIQVRDLLGCNLHYIFLIAVIPGEPCS